MIFIENIWRLKRKIKYFFLKQEININNKINFGSKIENNYFKKELKKCKFYFEYGSGSSTILADKLNKKFVSIESDKKFYNLLIARIKKKKFLKYFNLGIVGEFSYPIFTFKKQIINYIHSIDIYFQNKNKPDLILIDGRFRIACCLNLITKKKYKAKFKIILDDFKFRKDYYILKKFFKIKKVGRFGILSPLKNSLFKKNLINKFYYNCK